MLHHAPLLLESAPAICPVLGPLCAGALQVRLAVGEPEVEAAQALRYRVFVTEMGAHVPPEMHRARRDWDEFDPFCDHMLVLERTAEGARVVGTYRMLRREAMRRHGRFYTAGEFDIRVIADYPGEVMELGRSCVDAAYRNRSVMQLLWRGIGAYVARHRVEVLFGCASLHGTNPAEHAEALAYMHHYHRAPPELRIAALPDRYVPMDVRAKEALDARAAFAVLPPLLKGYLRLGGRVGDGAVIDHEYNTTDVGIVVKTDQVTDKYFQRYGQENS